ncbi:MAG: SDR family oxidoreductase [Polyangiaceae bacterium]
MGYQGKTAIVTGGASGIGRALSEELARRGARVVIADRQTELAAEIADTIPDARAVPLDVRDADAFAEAVGEVAQREGRVDLLFNNAGIGIGGEIRNHQLADWTDTFDVNLLGVVHGIQAAYPVMIAQGGGHIVNTASMAGLVAMGNLAAYSATKHAVVGISKALRIEGRALGVRCSVLCPGAIDTPILHGGRYGRFRGLTKDVVEEMWRLTRPIPPSELARETLDAVAKNEGIIIRPRAWKLLWWLERLSPDASIAFGQLVQRKLRERLAGVTADEAITSDEAPSRATP